MNKKEEEEINIIMNRGLMEGGPARNWADLCANHVNYFNQQ